MKIIFICIFIPAALGYPEGRTTETNKDVCKMDPPVELGNSISPGWFYNESLDLCQYDEFGAYKLDNEKSNRFSSLSECSKTCRRHVPRFCFDTAKKIGGKTNIMWTYNSTRGTCVRGYWKKEATEDSNVFDTEGDCLDICQGPDFGPCAQLPSEFDCEYDGTEYYRYNLTTQTCYRDRTLKCKGGKNAFPTLNACYARCGRFVKNKCKLPVQDLGMCSRNGPRYMFDRKEKKCKRYNGCDFHGIGFEKENDCVNLCEKKLDMTPTESCNDGEETA